MTNGQIGSVLRHLGARAGGEPAAGLADAQLLERFVASGDEAAFEVLLWRYGSMVLGVCRRVLRHEQDAEDAFQAAFLVLARKAATIGRRESVAGWLHRVAFRVALRARREAIQRSMLQPLDFDPVTPTAPEDAAWADLRPVLDEEINRLPVRYRAPFILCYLNGMTNEQAARELGCPKGTVLSRLSRARAKLRRRLTRRGLALAAGCPIVVLTERAAPAAALPLVRTTFTAALHFAAAQPAAAELVSTAAAALAKGTLQAMNAARTRILCLIVLLLVLLGLGGALTYQALAADPPPTAPSVEKTRARPLAGIDAPPAPHQDKAGPVAGGAKAEPAPGDRAAVVGGNTQFALDLYARLRARPGNLFVSPYSLSTALAMTRAGARGETANQMDKTLHFRLPQERLHGTFAALQRDFNGSSDGKKRPYELSVANALWGQKGYPFLPEYRKLIQDAYGGGYQEVDFLDDRAQAVATINRWVAGQTRDRIKDLLSIGDVSTQTRLVLTNAVYFKGTWAKLFPTADTHERPFTLADGKQLLVPQMTQTGQFPYYENSSLQMLALPYRGNELAMVVLLPKKGNRLDELENKLTADKLAGWLAGLRDHEVGVYLPKFKLESTYKLADTLGDMGMPLAFQPSRADLSGLDGTRRLFVHHVIQKTFVEVNETGTEAAAATAVTVDDESKPSYPMFRADHPFLFLIRDNRSGSILFLGRMANPRP
jgi:serpin B